MQLLKQGPHNKCLIYSTAMLLDRPPEVVEACLPKVNNRSHHIQEIIDYLWPHYRLMCIEAFPAVNSADNLVYTPEQAQQRWADYLWCRKGLIICEYVDSPGRHCVAWDGSQIYDPNGYIRSLDSPHYRFFEFYLMI